ncbi:MAG: exosortase/archaeosortase family protein [Chthoniobacteraceae bacterium]
MALIASITTLRNPKAYLPLAAYSVLWFLLLKHLSVHWSVNPQYSFGWLVPLLCIFIFYARWISRPQPGPAHAGARWIFCVTAFALLPTWLVEQPNPDWRLVSWFLALEVVILSLCAVYLAGGKPWLIHFAFSVCFILTSVPWPFGFEGIVVETLMQTAAAISVEVLNIVNIPALQHGNVIEITSGLLGIDEACSGIRSLQATIMVSLFLGELYRTTWKRRLLLLFAGVLFAFLCNVGRALLLASVAARDGIESVSKWHDPAGFTILTICFVILCILARIVAGPQRRIIRSGLVPSNPFPFWLTCTLAAWLFVTLAGSEIWYRWHESGETVRWSFQWPVSKKDFTDIAIPANAADLLKFDSGHAASWTESDGSRWSAFFLKWVAGPSRSRILARSHRPDICLPSAGYKLRKDSGLIMLRAGDLEIPFHVLEFEYGDQHADVFFCLWQDHSKTAKPAGDRNDWNRWAGIRSVLLGERNLGQQTLEIVITGCSSSETAEAMLRNRMESLVREDDKSSGRL